MNKLASLNDTEDHIDFSCSVRKSFQRSNIIQIILHIIMMILYPMATLFTIG